MANTSVTVITPLVAAVPLLVTVKLNEIAPPTATLEEAVLAIIRLGVPTGQFLISLLVVLELAEVVSPPPITLAVLLTGPGHAAAVMVAKMVSGFAELPAAIEVEVVHVTV